MYSIAHVVGVFRNHLLAGVQDSTPPIPARRGWDTRRSDGTSEALACVEGDDNNVSMDAASTSEDSSRRFLILGTAGHIDHGKTSLVKALTSVDTDRLPEEKKRGMTIELGFAHLTVGDVDFGVVDVPGHEKFVRTMVAGATGVDVALIVVAADDSVMPQTVEHVDILKLMGISRAVVAVTKCDVVDETMVEIVTEEVRELLAGSAFEAASVVPVSSVTGAGIETLKTALVDAATVDEYAARDRPFRMAIDRVFSVQGRGTVVTGSVLSGQVSSGDALALLPAGETCRVRDMQSHGTDTEQLQLGQRAALNLIGVDKDRIERGQELATPGFVVPTKRMDVWLEVLANATRALKPYATVRVCMGTHDVAARVVPLDRCAIEPGASAYVQLRTRERFLAAYGQRFIVREENDARTIGGGVVLRPIGKRWSRDRDMELAAMDALRTGDATARVEQVLIETGFGDVSDLQLSAWTGVGVVEITHVGAQLADAKKWISLNGWDRRVHPAVIESLSDRAHRWLERFHKQRPDDPGCATDAFVGWLERKTSAGLGRAMLELLLKKKSIVVRGRYVCAAAFAPAMSGQDQKVYDAMMKAFDAGAYQPPSLADVAKGAGSDVKRVQKLVKIATAYGDLVEIDGAIFLTAEHERNMRQVVADMIEAGGGATVSEVRERLNSSRKYAVPLMEHLDRVKFTVRDGDRRVLADGVTV